VKLANKFNGRFRGFAAAGSKIDAPAVAKIRGSQRKQPRGKFFGRRSVKLRSMREGDLRRLFRHRPPDFRNAVTDADDRGLARSIEIAPAALINDPAAFAARRDGIRLLEIAGEQPALRRHELPGAEL